MNALKLSSDRKVTPKARFSGSRWTPEIKNAFGLPAQTSCPGATELCLKVCYAQKLEKAYTNVDKLLHHNWDLLYGNRRSVPAMAFLLSMAVQEFDANHSKIEQKHGKIFDRVFRIHWDGDFFSVNYAKAWARVIKANPHIKFWAYTRTFTKSVNVVPYLADLDNLTLYLSVDKFNQARASVVVESNPWVKVAYLGDNWTDAQENVQVVIGKQAPKCPENTGRYDLVTDKEQGACVECMLCINGTNDVLFAIDKS